MHYDPMIYRPPYEARSALLQVTHGCSHNSCTFCTMYQGVKYSASPMEEILEDLEELAAYTPNATRVFLENGDALSLPTGKLLITSDAIHEALPNVKTITGYASVKNLRGKTDEELKALATAGFGELNIGVESGLDDVLSFMNKGFTLEEAKVTFRRMREAGLTFSLNIINAAAGPKRIEEHARANAELCNEAQPYLLFVSPLHVDPGSRLEKIVQSGGFEESTLGEYIHEEIAFLEGLELENCIFFGLHVSNPVPVIGRLPEDKEQLLQELRDGMSRIPKSRLDSHPSKGAEGRLL